MMKILTSPHISPFGGLNFVIKALDDLAVGTTLNQQLPKLSAQSHYDWRDICYSLWSIMFCGGDCIEDLGTNLKSSLANIPGLNVPSPDRVLDRLKELSQGSVHYTSARGTAIHQFCHNDLLNELNLKLLKNMPGFSLKDVTLDYDNTLLFHHKQDAKRTYKQELGYTPGVGIIGSKVVFVEGRNGNSEPKFLQSETLKRMFTMLEEQGCSVSKFRVDAASFQFETMNVIAQHCEHFYVRAVMSSTIANAIHEVKKWKPIQMGDQTFYRGECEFIPFPSYQIKKGKSLPNIPYRLIITKTERADGQIHAFTGEACIYSTIMTNDRELSADQVVDFYNQRGAIEKQFDVLKNDFCWKRLPFSKLDQNNVFLILTAICRNLYDHIIHLFARRYKGLMSTDRMKKFIFRFICIPAKWVRQARGWKLRIYGNLPIRT